MSDIPENLPEIPAARADADSKRRAAIKAGLLAAPAVLTLMARSSLALADNNGTPGAASAGSTSTARDNNGNHYGWDKNKTQGNDPKFAADPVPSAPAPASASSSSSASSSASSAAEFSTNSSANSASTTGSDAGSK